MDKVFEEASDLIAGLRYVDDIELVADDIVGCMSRVFDQPTSDKDPRDRRSRVRKSRV